MRSTPARASPIPASQGILLSIMAGSPRLGRGDDKKGRLAPSAGRLLSFLLSDHGATSIMAGPQHRPWGGAPERRVSASAGRLTGQTTEGAGTPRAGPFCHFSRSFACLALYFGGASWLLQGS